QIDYEIKHESEDKASSADSFFEKPGKVIEKNGKYYLEVTVTSWDMIDHLKANGKAVEIVKEDNKNNLAIVRIPVNKDLSKIVTLRMKVTFAGLYEMEHDARLVMDESSLQADEKPSEKPSEKPTEQPGSKPEEKPENPQAEVLADKTYDIDYTVMHEKENKPS